MHRLEDRANLLQLMVFTLNKKVFLEVLEAQSQNLWDSLCKDRPEYFVIMIVGKMFLILVLL